MRNAIARPKRPVASASAKPRNANGVTCAAGLRASELMSAENTLPMPIPAPTRAMQARPAPIIFAAARSISIPLVGSVRSLMQMNGVAQIEAGQDGEDVSLQHRHQQFEEDEQHVDAQRDDAEDSHADDEAG